MRPQYYEKIDIDKYIEDILEELPEITKPILSDEKIYNILNVTDIHLDMNYKPGSNSNCEDPRCC